jgi:hypothetical protein
MLNIATQGQIFDEGKSLRPNTVKECFPPPETGTGAAVLLTRPLEQVFD